MDVSTTLNGNYAVSSSCGSFSTTSTTLVDVTNLSVTLTTTGRPILVKVIPDAIGESSIGIVTPTLGVVNFEFYRDSTKIGNHVILAQDDLKLPTSLFTVDFPSPGTYTFKLKAKKDALATYATLNACKLFVIEY